MRGLLLDPITGSVEGASSIENLKDFDKQQYIKRTRDLIKSAQRFPDLKNTQTTLRYLSYPPAANGISRASSGGTAWSFSAYTEVVPVNTITTDYYIAAVVLMSPAATATVTTNEFIIEFATGGAGSEVTIIQIPFVVRNVTAAGYIPGVIFPLVEPKFVAANTRISTRFAYSVTTTSVTITGIKIMYQTV